MRSRNRIRRFSFLDELQAIGVGESLHESHEPVPLPRSPHHVLGLDSRRFSINELGVHIHRLNHTFLIDHVESGNVPDLPRRVEHRRLLELENGHSVGAVSGFGQPHVRHRLLVRALDELDLRQNHEDRIGRPSVGLTSAASDRLAFSARDVKGTAVECGEDAAVESGGGKSCWRRVSLVMMMMRIRVGERGMQRVIELPLVLVDEEWCRWGEEREVDARDCRVAIDFETQPAEREREREREIKGKRKGRMVWCEDW